MNILLGERETAAIENNFMESDEINFKTDNVIELRLNSEGDS